MNLADGPVQNDKTIEYISSLKFKAEIGEYVQCTVYLSACKKKSWNHSLENLVELRSFSTLYLEACLEPSKVLCQSQVSICFDIVHSQASETEATTWLNVVLWSMGYIKDWQAYYRFQAHPPQSGKH